jgi:hypothetical protein
MEKTIQLLTYNFNSSVRNARSKINDKYAHNMSETQQRIDTYHAKINNLTSKRNKLVECFKSGIFDEMPFDTIPNFTILNTNSLYNYVCHNEFVKTNCIVLQYNNTEMLLPNMFTLKSEYIETKVVITKGTIYIYYKVICDVDESIIHYALCFCGQNIKGGKYTMKMKEANELNECVHLNECESNDTEKVILKYFQNQLYHASKDLHDQILAMENAKKRLMKLQNELDDTPKYLTDAIAKLAGGIKYFPFLYAKYVVEYSGHEHINIIDCMNYSSSQLTSFDTTPSMNEFAVNRTQEIMLEMLTGVWFNRGDLANIDMPMLDDYFNISFTNNGSPVNASYRLRYASYSRGMYSSSGEYTIRVYISYQILEDVDNVNLKIVFCDSDTHQYMLANVKKNNIMGRVLNGTLLTYDSNMVRFEKGKHVYIIKNIEYTGITWTSWIIKIINDGKTILKSSESGIRRGEDFYINWIRRHINDITDDYKVHVDKNMLTYALASFSS